MMKRLQSIVWPWRWAVGFALAIALAIGMRTPYLDDGHVDEYHTIGRALYMMYTGDFSPKFFRYPTGAIYLSIGANSLSLASIGREVTEGTFKTSLSPLARLKQENANPLQMYLYDSPGSELFQTFKERARYYWMMWVPLTILLLAYIGWRLNLLAPALAASFLLAFSSASRLESVYIAINTPAGFFVLLTVAAAAWLAARGAPTTLGAWFWRIAILSFLAGLAAGMKYNAGVCWLIAIVYGALTLPRYESGESKPEWIALALAAGGAALMAGFTLTTPYWLEDFRVFVDDVLYEVWHMQIGHADYNTFSPGLQMGYIVLRSVSDQIAWTGIALTLAAAGYLFAKGLNSNRDKGALRVALLPAALCCVAFLLLMSNQAVFWTRNMNIILPTLLLCCATAWFLAAERLCERYAPAKRAWLPTVSLAALTAFLIFKANWLNIVLNPGREWWR